LCFIRVSITKFTTPIHTMYTTITEITELLKRYLEGTIHPESHVGLQQLFEKYPDLLLIVNELEDPAQLEASLVAFKQLYTLDAAVQEQRVLDRILQQVEVAPQPKVKNKQLTVLLYAAVAACVLLAIGLTFRKIKEKPVYSEEETLELAEQLTPGGNRAVLTASDGTALTLSEDKVGIVMGDDITYDDGSVLLSDKEAAVMLTLSTPKGGQYQIVLADGTKVWLNAGSKLQYPKTFTGNVREVELDGEAYFEVAKNKQKPFIVSTGNEKVEVMGTHFNVNAYAEDHESKVSLLEGKVRVSIPQGGEKVLNPGQQTVVRGERIRVQEVNLDEIMAWKNGEFMFNNETLRTALRQVSRWYDIDIQVDPALADITLWGTVSRLDNFDKVLKVIKMTDDNIKINLDGRKVRLMK